MQCPKCGFLMSAFDEDCPRCKNLANQPQAAAPPTTQAQQPTPVQQQLPTQSPVNTHFANQNQPPIANPQVVHVQPKGSFFSSIGAGAGLGIGCCCLFPIIIFFIFIFLSVMGTVGSRMHDNINKKTPNWNQPTPSYYVIPSDNKWNKVPHIA
jgi:hypothetical protein